MPTKTIRDFLYLDADRLYSWYAQLFGGIPGAILTTMKWSEESTVDHGSLPSGIESAGRERTETTALSLHDWMYHRLERELLKAGAVCDIPDACGDECLREDTVRRELLSRPLVRVEGYGWLDDLAHLSDFATHFNDIAGFSGWSVLGMPDPDDTASTKAKGASQPVTQAMKALREGKWRPIAKLAGLALPEPLTKGIVSVLEEVYEKPTYIRVRPFADDPELLFSAMVRSEWLRYDSACLRRWHGRRFPFRICIAGQIGMALTADESAEIRGRLGPDAIATEQPLEDVAVGLNGAMSTADGDARTIGEMLHPVLEQVGAFQELFSAELHPAVSMVPLAVYREFTVPDVRQGDTT